MSEIDTKAIRERADKATPGPWTAMGCVGANLWQQKDMEFICHARDDVPALLDALAAAEARADAEHARAERVAGQNARLLRYVLAVRRMKRCTAQELYAARLEEGNAYDALHPGDLGGDE